MGHVKSLWSLTLGDMLVSMVHATTKDHASVHNATETVLMSMTHVTTEGHRDVYSLCCHLKPSCYLRSTLLQ